MKQKVPYSPLTLRDPEKAAEGRCWPKNMYFRGDAQFYAELDQKLQEARRNEIRWTGTKKQRQRAADLFLQTHPRVKNVWACGGKRVLWPSYLECARRLVLPCAGPDDTLFRIWARMRSPVREEAISR